MGQARQARLEPSVSVRRYDRLRAAPLLYRLAAAVQGLAGDTPRPLRAPIRSPLAGQLRSPGWRGGEEFTGPHALAKALELPPGRALREAQVLNRPLPVIL